MGALSLCLTAMVLAPAASSVAEDSPGRTTAREQSPDPSSNVPGYAYPRNAGKVYRWGVEAWEDEFEVGSLRKTWKSNKPRFVGQQVGQLTLAGGPKSGTVKTTASDHSAKYGRWEARVRAKQIDESAAPFRFYWELVPVGKFRCGGKSIVIASYREDQPRVRGAVRVKGDTEFAFSKKMRLTHGHYHSYAIEVTPKRISWFVDTKVVRTEKRPEATRGTTYKPRFRMQAQKGRTMAKSNLQMDWVRYYTLDRPNAKPVAAPKMKKRPYKGAC